MKYPSSFANAAFSVVGLAVGLVALACSPNDTIDRDLGPVGTGGVAVEPGAGGAGGVSATGGNSGGGVGGVGGGAMGGMAGLPPAPVSCGEVMGWMAGGDYKEGTRVAAGSPARLYECLPWPNSGWCPMAAYEPGKADGFWKDAWKDVGPCP
jgi:hypothetical protein